MGVATRPQWELESAVCCYIQEFHSDWSGYEADSAQISNENDIVIIKSIMAGLAHFALDCNGIFTNRKNRIFENYFRYRDGYQKLGC